MKYITIPPSPCLEKFVRFYWVLEGEVQESDPYVHRTLADGCTELIFHYKGRFDELMTSGKAERSFVSGFHAQSRLFRRFSINEDFGIFGVYLYPFALPALFSIPATELTDEMPDSYSLLGNEGNILEERMMLAVDNCARVKIISDFLEKKLCKAPTEPSGVFTSVQYIIKSKGTTDVKNLADKFSFSTRQFERRFKDASGFSPKLYSRIIRFQAASAEYRNQNKTLTEIAYLCGYYDQSHFIHDFKEFSGYHPKTYFSGNNEGTDWMDG